MNISDFSFYKALDLLKEKLYVWLENCVLLLPNLLVALLVLVIFYFIASSLSKLTKKILVKYLQNYSLANFLATVLYVSVFLLGFIVAINVMHLDKAVTSVLAGVGIAGVALGFAFQDITANLLSGVALVIKRDYPFKAGDMIETNGFIGNVQEIDLRSTMIKTFQGPTVIIPNRLIYENPLTNYNFDNTRRVDLDVGVSYSSNLREVKEIVLEAVKDIDRDKSREPQVYFKEFGDSSINFTLRFWVPFVKQTEFLEARHQAVIAIKESFDKHGITIPFPIRTLDFAGQALAVEQK